MYNTIEDETMKYIEKKISKARVLAHNASLRQVLVNAMIAYHDVPVSNNLSFFFHVLY